MSDRMAKVSHYKRRYIGRCPYVKWIFGGVKLPIDSKTVVNSWGCSRHLQQMLPVMKRCPRQVPNQVKCKNPRIKRWGSAWDANVTLPQPPKLSLLNNNAGTSAAKASNIASMANQAYRPWGGPVVATDALHWRHDHHDWQTSGWRCVHSSCLRLANKH